jgi:hypothetical protein
MGCCQLLLQVVAALLVLLVLPVVGAGQAASAALLLLLLLAVSKGPPGVVLQVVGSRSLLQGSHLTVMQHPHAHRPQGKKVEISIHMFAISKEQNVCTELSTWASVLVTWS